MLTSSKEMPITETVVKAAISSIPHVGNALGSVASDLYSNFASRRLSIVLHAFNERLKGVELRQDVEFENLLFRAIQIALRDCRQFKKSVLLSVIENGNSDPTTALDWHEMVLNLVDQLEPHHMLILRVLGAQDQLQECKDCKKSHANFADIQSALSSRVNVPADLTEDAVHEGLSTLSKLGLVRSHGGERSLVLSAGSSLEALMRKSHFWLTPMGIAFLEHIEGDQ